MKKALDDDCINEREVGNMMKDTSPKTKLEQIIIKFGN